MGVGRRPKRRARRLVVREMRPEDGGLLARWNRDLAVHIARAVPQYLSPRPPAQYGQVYVAGWLRTLRKNGGFAIIAEWDGRPVGFVSVDLPEAPSRLQRWEGRPTVIAHLRDAYVEAPARRKGIGTALFDEAEARLRALGFDAVFLHAAPSNRGAMRFYRSRGFVVDQVRFRRRLGSPPKSWAVVATRRARARRRLRTGKSRA
jgi:ribosomal protein S18 acetylase RimI-like enzyme